MAECPPVNLDGRSSAGRKGHNSGGAMRRAPRACLACRARKVRCDIAESESCTNCRQDRIQCVVPRSRRSRKTLFDAHESLTGSADSATTYVDTRHILKNTTTSAETSSSSILVAADELGNASLRTGSDRDSSSLSTLGVGETALPLAAVSLPGFIKAPGPQDGTTLDYIAAYGGFSLPPVAVQCALVEAFLDFSHSRNPCLDLAEFLAVLESPDGGNGQVSLLLYQTILYEGAATVPGEVLEKNGLGTRSAFRASLYRRVEALYELASEVDEIVAIQAALVLSYRGTSRSSQDRKDSWYWLNMAITKCIAMGLNHSSTYSGFVEGRRKLLRRLWWACYTGDKLLAIGLGRPIRIKDSDHDVPMLRQDDVEQGSLTRSHLILNSAQIGPHSSDTLAASADLFIETAKLSVIMSRILKFREYLFDEDTPTPLEGPQAMVTVYIERLCSVMRKWLQELPKSCRVSEAPADYAEDNLTRDIIARRHMLQIAFYNAVYALHRPLFVAEDPYPRVSSISDSLREKSQMIALHAVQRITYESAKLAHGRLDEHLPMFGIMGISPALFVHLINMKGNATGNPEMALFSFRVCMRLMDKLRRTYSTASTMIEYLETLVHQSSDGRVTLPSVESIVKLNQTDFNDLSAILAYGPGRFLTHNPDKAASLAVQDAGLAGFEAAISRGFVRAPNADLDRWNGNAQPDAASFRDQYQQRDLLPTEHLVDSSSHGAVSPNNLWTELVDPELAWLEHGTYE